MAIFFEDALGSVLYSNFCIDEGYRNEIIFSKELVMLSGSWQFLGIRLENFESAPFSDLSIFFLSFTDAIPFSFALLYASLLCEMKVCYDWSKGAENHNPSTAKTNIYLHQPQVQFSYF